MKIITNNSDETKNFGKEFTKKIHGGDTVLLIGNLGAGKTTFVQGFAQGLGIKDRILSPTFVLQRIHEIPESDIKRLNHIDLYRIENPTEIENLGLEETINDDSSIALIEWADRIKDFNPQKGYRLNFKYLSDNQREIEVKRL